MGPPEGPAAPSSAERGNEERVARGDELRDAGVSHRRRSLRRHTPGQITGQVIDELTRIVFGTTDERRLPSPQERQPKRVQAWRIDDAPVVPQVSFVVNHGHVQPACSRAGIPSPTRSNGSLHSADRVSAVTTPARVSAQTVPADRPRPRGRGSAPTHRTCRATGSSSGLPAQTDFAVHRRTVPVRRAPRRDGRQSRHQRN